MHKSPPLLFILVVVQGFPQAQEQSPSGVEETGRKALSSDQRGHEPPDTAFVKSQLGGFNCSEAGNHLAPGGQAAYYSCDEGGRARYTGCADERGNFVAPGRTFLFTDNGGNRFQLRCVLRNSAQSSGFLVSLIACLDQDGLRFGPGQTFAYYTTRMNHQGHWLEVGFLRKCLDMGEGRFGTVGLACAGLGGQRVEVGAPAYRPYPYSIPDLRLYCRWRPGQLYFGTQPDQTTTNITPSKATPINSSATKTTTTSPTTTAALPDLDGNPSEPAKTPHSSNKTTTDGLRTTTTTTTTTTDFATTTTTYPGPDFEPMGSRRRRAAEAPLNFQENIQSMQAFSGWLHWKQ